MTTARSTFVRVGAALFALSLIAAACGNDGDTASETPTTAAAAPATTAAAAPATTAAAAPADPLGPLNEAKGEPIIVGWSDDGKSASVDNSIDAFVAEATVSYINKHLNGIFGRPIKLVKCEILNDPALAADCANKHIESNAVASLMATSGLSGEVWDVVNAVGIPFFCGSCALPRQTSDAKNTFLMVNAIAGSLGFPIAYAQANNYKNIAAFIIGMPAAVDPQQLPKAAGAALGINYEIISIPPGIPDATAQVTAALAKNPDMVSLVFDPAGCLTVLTALEEAEYKGAIQTFDYCVSSKVYEPLSPEFKKKLVVGASVAMGLPAGTDKDWDLYQAIMKKYAERQPEVSGVRGWAYQTVMSFYLGVTGGKIDPKNVTPETVSAAMHAMTPQVLPLTQGSTIQCNGQAFVPGPAFCGKGAMVTSLDENANFVSYKAVDTSNAVKAIGDFLIASAKK